MRARLGAWLLLGVAVLLALATPANAHHRPGHDHGPTTTTATTLPEPTTTVASTTTTNPPATTTTATTLPEPTTTLPVACSPPVTITAGGTYSGCYASADPAVAAVTLATTEPVTLDHAQVRHAGDGIAAAVAGVHLVVRDSVLVGTDPGAVVVHRAVELHAPAAVEIDHNRLVDGDGVWVCCTAGPVAFTANDVTDVGRWPHPPTPNCCVQAIQLDHVTTPGLVEWNRVRNTSGTSGVEDNVNLYASGGSDATHPLVISHNLIDGAYPRQAGDTRYTGGGIMTGDGGGSHALAAANTVVSTTNYGVAAHGTDNHLDGNVLVNDTLGSDGQTRYLSDFGQAVSIYDGSSISATGNRYNWLRDATGTQFPCWQAAYCTGGVQVALSEQQARDDWEAARIAAGVRIGPG